MRLLPHLLCLASLMDLAACTTSMLDLRNDLDLPRASFLDKLHADDQLARRYVACAAPSRRKHPQQADTPTDPIAELIQRLRDRHPRETETLTGLQDLVFDLEGSSGRRLNLAVLRRVVTAIGQWHTRMDFDEDDLERDVSRFSLLLSAYNKAYFGDIAFRRQTPRIEQVASNGFIDRTGNVFLFPGLSQDLSMPDRSVRTVAKSVTSQEVSADLIRIFLEAFFDAAFEVPAVREATALTVSWPAQISPYPELDADHPAIPPEAMARLTRDALRAEAAVTTEVGKAVRGAGVFGTGNETLAASLETAGGVLAKKLVEHEGFCYFQVRQGTGSRQEPVPASEQTSGSPGVK